MSLPLPLSTMLALHVHCAADDLCARCDFNSFFALLRPRQFRAHINQIKLAQLRMLHRSFRLLTTDIQCSA